MHRCTDKPSKMQTLAVVSSAHKERAVDQRAWMSQINYDSLLIISDSDVWQTWCQDHEIVSIINDSTLKHTYTLENIESIFKIRNINKRHT